MTRVIRLNDIKNEPNLLGELLSIPLVHIFSDEHSAYWRSGGSGYTVHIPSAGVFTGRDAYERTKHCGKEKFIEYEEATLHIENNKMKQQIAEAKRIANNAIYLNDSSDFVSSLCRVCNLLGMEVDKIGKNIDKEV